MNALGQPPLVCLITPGEARDPTFAQNKRAILEIVSAAVEAGVSIVQIREKELSARLLCEVAEAVVAVARGSSTKILVNDRAAIAVASGAGGVHLPAHSIPVSVVRATFGLEFIIGASTHSIEEVKAAAADGADFAVFGPVFTTPGKGEPQGLEPLARACERVRPFPVLAIGGIDETNCESVIAAGARGIAAIRALNEPDSLRAICARLLK